MTPFYDLYPKDPIENLKWRIRCSERAIVDRRFRQALIDACMTDVLFWMAFACWSFEPRAKIKVRPFIPWVHQERVFVKIDEAVDESERTEESVDVIVDKSRAQGGTFGYLWIDLRRWLRDPMFSAGYVTRNESLVDSKTDSDTLFWKLDWAIGKLPFWLIPEGFDWKQHRSYSSHSLLNPANGASLVGYAAGQDVGTGGRKTVFTVDEAGARDFVSGAKDEAVQESLHDVTNCAAEGTLVVTDRGPVAIEKVRIDDLVWDGTMWVSHDGCVFQGWRETISAYGVSLTPDHLVLTVEGWKHAIDRLDREEVRLPDGYSAKWFVNAKWEEGQREMVVPVHLRSGAFCGRVEADSWGKPELRLQEGGVHHGVAHDSRDDRNYHLPCLGQHDEALPESEGGAILPIWRTRDRSLQALDEVRELLGGYGDSPFSEAQPRPQGQRQGLLEEELPVGDVHPAVQQQVQQSLHRDSAGTAYTGSGVEDCGSDSGSNQGQDSSWNVRQGLTSASDGRRTEAVYDLLNCGPRAAFTVIGDDGPLLVHNCLRMVSARYVDAGVFHEACENPDTAKNNVYLVLDWKDNPLHGKNSYVVTNGVPTARKKHEQGAVAAYHADNKDLRARLERKGFKFEGVVRSPWYDMRCLRPTSTPRLIASQLDRNPRGAVGKAFPIDLLDRVKREKCKPPIWQGQPVFDSETLVLKGLISREDGPLKLWFKPGVDHSAPLGPFTVGCDMAAGSDGAYASNSVAHGIDDRTGEQVLEYAVKGLELIKFARVVVGLCLWLRNAYLGWEDSGMAAPFAKEIMEVIYYGNVYYRDVAEIGSRRKSRKAGWSNRSNEDKADLFEKMALGMETGDFTVRSEDLIRECAEYEWEKGKIIHAPTKNRNAVETNHGDRVIAGGVAWMIYSSERHETKIDTTEETGETPQYGSFLWREQREQRRVGSGSPQFGIRDVVSY